MDSEQSAESKLNLLSVVPDAAEIQEEVDAAEPANPVGDDQGDSKPWEALGLSKTQYKKRMKKQKINEFHKQKKQQKKADKQQSQQEKKQERQTRFSTKTEEEKQQWLEHTAEIMASRKKNKEERIERLTRAKADGIKLVIDLDFEEKMTDSEIKSLCQQLSYSYSCNKHAEVPFNLLLTSFKGRIKSQAENQLAGFDNWSITTSQDGYFDCLEAERDKLVYLTADSTNELTDLDASSVYIIGGLVDRNRYKQICFNKATEQGIKTARLPIAQHVTLDSSQVITINQVVKIMVEFAHKRDWKEVLVSVLPTRKVAGRKRGTSTSSEPGSSECDAAEPKGERNEAPQQQKELAQERQEAVAPEAGALALVAAADS